MRPKRKIFYVVQDWNHTPSLWWHKGKWGECGPGASSSKECRTLHSALRQARRIVVKGGNPLVSRCILTKNGYSWEDYDFNG